MKKLVTLLCLSYFYLICNAQPDKCPSIVELQNKIRSDSIYMHYPDIIGIPEKYRMSVFMTLSYFTELSNCRIVFKSVSIPTTVNVRPSFGSTVFRSKDKRKYIIRINNSSEDSIVTFNELSPGAIIGLLGHEFSHIVDYKSKNKWGILRRANAYLYKRKKERYEKEIDSLTIQRGLGCFLYEWSVFLLYTSDASYKYKQFKRDVYMKPEEIEKYCNWINSAKSFAE